MHRRRSPMDRPSLLRLAGAMTTTLVLGGTGTTGRRIAHHLRSAGHLVRTASRTGSDVPLDLDDPATWPMALDGITAAYLVEPAVRAGQDRLARFAEAAIEAGVRRLVLLSAARAAEPTHPLHGVEQTVRGSGVGWTVLHPNWFAQNFSEGPWVRSVLDGTLALPAGDGRLAELLEQHLAVREHAVHRRRRHRGCRRSRAHRRTPPRSHLRTDRTGGHHLPGGNRHHLEGQRPHGRVRRRGSQRTHQAADRERRTSGDR